MTAITGFHPSQRDEAHAYAAEIGGYVDTFNEQGMLAVFHDNPEGVAVRLWSSIDLPEGTTLQRRDSIRVGDVVVSSNSGQRTVEKAIQHGSNPGTTYLRLRGLASGPEAYPGDSFIPVVSRAPEPKAADPSAAAPAALEPLTAEDLAALPLGAVILDSGKHDRRGNERCAWTKTSDTIRLVRDVDPHCDWCDVDDEPPGAAYAWASVQWKHDLLDAEIVEQHGPLFLLWDGVSPLGTR